MDPASAFGLAASAAQLSGQSLQVVSELCKLGAKIKHSDRYLDRISRDVNAIDMLIGTFKDIAKGAHGALDTLEISRNDSKEPALAFFKGEVETICNQLRQLLDSVNKKYNRIWKFKWVRKISRGGKYVLSEEKFQDLTTRMSKAQLNLITVLAMSSLKMQAAANVSPVWKTAIEDAIKKLPDLPAEVEEKVKKQLQAVKEDRLQEQRSCSVQNTQTGQPSALKLRETSRPAGNDRKARFQMPYFGVESSTSLAGSIKALPARFRKRKVSGRNPGCDSHTEFSLNEGYSLDNTIPQVCQHKSGPKSPGRLYEIDAGNGSESQSSDPKLDDVDDDDISESSCDESWQQPLPEHLQSISNEDEDSDRRLDMRSNSSDENSQRASSTSSDEQDPTVESGKDPLAFQRSFDLNTASKIGLWTPFPAGRMPDRSIDPDDHCSGWTFCVSQVCVENDHSPVQFQLLEPKSIPQVTFNLLSRCPDICSHLMIRVSGPSSLMEECLYTSNRGVGIINSTSACSMFAPNDHKHTWVWIDGDLRCAVRTHLAAVVGEASQVGIDVKRQDNVPIQSAYRLSPFPCLPCLNCSKVFVPHMPTLVYGTQVVDTFKGEAWERWLIYQCEECHKKMEIQLTMAWRPTSQSFVWPRKWAGEWNFRVG